MNITIRTFVNIVVGVNILLFNVQQVEGGGYTGGWANKMICSTCLNCMKCCDSSRGICANRDIGPQCKPEAVFPKHWSSDPWCCFPEEYSWSRSCCCHAGGSCEVCDRGLICDYDLGCVEPPTAAPTVSASPSVSSGPSSAPSISAQPSISAAPSPLTLENAINIECSEGGDFQKCLQLCHDYRQPSGCCVPFGLINTYWRRCDENPGLVDTPPLGTAEYCAVFENCPKEEELCQGECTNSADCEAKALSMGLSLGSAHGNDWNRQSAQDHGVYNGCFYYPSTNEAYWVGGGSCAQVRMTPTDDDIVRIRCDDGEEEQGDVDANESEKAAGDGEAEHKEHGHGHGHHGEEKGSDHGGHDHGGHDHGHSHNEKAASDGEDEHKEHGHGHGHHGEAKGHDHGGHDHGQSHNTKTEEEVCEGGCMTAEDCLDAARSMGLSSGSAEFPFVGDWPDKGCFYYDSFSAYPNQAYYGRGGTCAEVTTTEMVDIAAIRISCDGSGSG